MDRTAKLTAAAAGLLIAAGLHGPSAASCAEEAGCPALMSQSVTQTFIQDRLNRSTALAPDSRIQSRLQGDAWNPATSGASPVTINPNGDATEFGTSLSQVGSWMARSDAEKIDQSKPLLSGAGKAPAPARLDQQQMDVWTRTRIMPFKAADGENRGQATTSSVGADYKPLPGLLVGGMVQLDSAEQNGVVAGGTASGQGYMAGPYVAMKLSPNLTLDARAAWGQADDSVRAGGATSKVETTRHQALARLKGDWNWQSWHLSPSATVESSNENASAASGLAEAEAGGNRVSVGPRLSRPVELGQGTRIEPFVHMNGSVDLDNAEALLSDPSGESASAHRTYGAGLSLSQTDEYRFEATADLEDPGNGADKTVRGGVKLTIPLD